MREPDVGSKVTFSFLSIIIIASVVLIGPVGPLASSAPSPWASNAGGARAGPRCSTRGWRPSTASVGGLVYLAARWRADVSDLCTAPGDLAHAWSGLPLMVADVAQMLINAVLFAGVVRLSDRRPRCAASVVQMITNSGSAYIGYGVIGFLFVILWGPADVGPFSAVLILAPLFVARWAFVQYGDEQRAHERTLSALVTAVETKDPTPPGHSGRIARLAEWMAEPLVDGAPGGPGARFAGDAPRRRQGRRPHSRPAVEPRALSTAELECAHASPRSRRRPGAARSSS